MKDEIRKIQEEAELIGNNSYELQNFVQLPEDATKEQMIEALRADQRWQENHLDDISRQISCLIEEIETSL